jgi:phenylpropionate dioxygenase-like ring-hydroxylating dioxygenase large terminal subunit
MTFAHFTPGGGPDLFDADATRSFTLDAQLYYDAGVFEREEAAIFHRAWMQVGHVEEAPETGDYFTCAVIDQSLFVIRDKGGDLRAFHNLCPHRTHELLQGRGNTKAIQCPYHAWSFEIDGALRRARFSDAVAGFDADDFCLKEVRLETLCGFIFVNLDPEASPMGHMFAGLEAEVRHYTPNLDQLTHAYRVTFDLAANWKTVIDNYLECYHCQTVHPALAHSLDLDDYRISISGNYATFLTAAKEGVKSTTFDFEGAALKHQCNWWIWPNLCWEQFPGRGSIMIYNHLPVGPERTLQVVDFYFADKAPNAHEMGEIEYVEKVLRPEDQAVVESVQRGLRSRGYQQGRFMVDPARASGWSEHAVHHFQTLVKAALEG